MSNENNNLDTAEECGSCSFERVICLQEGECLLHKLEELQEYRKLGTLKELKSLKEKQIQKEKYDEMTVLCDSCGYRYINDGYPPLPKYCNRCGKELHNHKLTI